jgi:putative heme-binding domain-containing protein
LLTETDDKRKDVIKQYQASFNMKGNSLKGMSVFQLNCAICHQIGGKMGRRFGPDLGTVHAWSPLDIMTNILDPNKSIALGYDMWSVKLNNGKLLQGVISSETPTAISISSTDGEVTNIARKDISSLTALRMSAMPVAFEKKINKQQMADLLSYLREGE